MRRMLGHTPYARSHPPTHIHTHTRTHPSTAAPAQHCFMKMSTSEEPFINIVNDRRELANAFTFANADRKMHNDPNSLTRFEFVELLIHWASIKFGEGTRTCALC